MRLDHLLSKEQHVHPAGIPGVTGWGGHFLTPACGVVVVARGIVELLGICSLSMMLIRASTAGGFGRLCGTCVVGLLVVDVCWRAVGS